MARAMGISRTVQDRDYGFALALCGISAGPAILLLAVCTIATPILLLSALIRKEKSPIRSLCDVYHDIWIHYLHHFIIAAVGIAICSSGLILAWLRIP